MKSEIWDEKKAQKAKTIVQYLIDNVKNVSVFISPPIRIEHFPTKHHPYITQSPDLSHMVFTPFDPCHRHET